MMNFNTDNIILFPFKSRIHLLRHLNYLFRTDDDQKWTNRDTDKNRIIMNNSIYTVGTTLANRKDAENMVIDHIREQKADYKHLYMCRIEYPDDELYYFDDLLLTKALDTIQEVDKDLAKDDMKILIGVTHEDQIREYLHFHLLICNER